jgi:hypothetical protein
MQWTVLRRGTASAAYSPKARCTGLNPRFVTWSRYGAACGYEWVPGAGWTQGPLVPRETLRRLKTVGTSAPEQYSLLFEPKSLAKYHINCSEFGFFSSLIIFDVTKPYIP